jgi:hypothetical protein
LVEEHSNQRRRYLVRGVGAVRKADVGMSNDKTGEKPVRRKDKGSVIYGNQIRVSRALRISREVKPMESELIFLHLYIMRWEDEGA